jgi:hypothetical protein
MRAMAKINVRQPDDAKQQVPTEVLATSIVSIADGIKKLRSGRLTDKALFLLIQHAAPSVGGRGGYSPISIKDIKAVFEGIENLESAFIKKAVKISR